MTPYTVGPLSQIFGLFNNKGVCLFFFWLFCFQDSADQANGVGGRSETDQPAWIIALMSDREVREAR